MKVIIGLGNPGEKYLATRHNLGFMVLDSYAQKHSPAEYSFNEDNKIKAEVLKLSPDLWLVKPLTFMNNSGLTVKTLVDYYKVSLEDIIIVYDELDLPLGQIKIRLGGAAAGHHGVESILTSLGTDKFLRLRIGIGNRSSKEGERGEHHFEGEKYVIDKFDQKERAKVKHTLKQVIEALDLLLEKGIESAQNKFH